VRTLKEEFGYKNEMQIPRLDKIVLNIGLWCWKLFVTARKQNPHRKI